jgi:malonyl-CoA/methylmalonyl-CoA synthetase
VHNARSLVDAWGFTESDTVLHVLPLHHTHGLFVALHCALASGSAVVLSERFEPADAVALMPSCTVMMGVPTHYVRLLAEPSFDAVSTASLRLMTSGSAPLTPATHAAVRERTGHVVLERYGMTETSILTSNPLVGERRPGTVGQALPGVGVRVVDDGDAPVAVDVVGAVQVRGPNVFAGYWRRPELRASDLTADGWFRTGDVGSLSADGYLTIVGRSKDLVISGGLNVYPKEVEAVLDDLPQVRESAVVGVPDADLGESVVAVVVAADGVGADELSVDAVRAACRSRLATYKLPRRVVVVDDLPRNAMGKVEKARLRAMLDG